MKYEKSKSDKEKDKKRGIKEGSKKDMRLDKMMQGSSYKKDKELGEAMSKLR